MSVRRKKHCYTTEDMEKVLSNWNSNMWMCDLADEMGMELHQVKYIVQQLRRRGINLPQLRRGKKEKFNKFDKFVNSLQ